MPDITRLERVEAALHRIEQKIDTLIRLASVQLKENLVIMQNFDALTQKVAEVEAGEQSAITLITELAAEVRATAPTQEAIDALAARLDASKAALAAAVVANPAT
jgi:hypothetical protein